MKDFAKRKCLFCGNKFDPAEHTARPHIAAAMLYCSPVCKNAAWRAANREKVRESNRATSAAWYAALDESEKKVRISQIAAAEKARKNS